MSMTYVALPFAEAQPLSFYLAMEEHVARHKAGADYFFMWQVEPSVIFGRNQLIENEVNLDYCRQHGIHTFRRKSGGGCVYADMNNIMFSYITDDENVGFTFNRYINMVVLMLHRLGIEATTTGRNDIMIGGRKVSGNAFYHLPGRSIVHGTMLYDTNMQHMVGSITPSDEKLLSKGIQSVRQHITLLKDYTSLSIEDFKSFVRKSLCDRELLLTEADIVAIRELEQEYRSPEFILGNNPRYSVVRRGRIEGVGELEVRLELKNNVIKAVNIVGDYFLTGDLDGRLIRPMLGQPLDLQALQKALPESLGDIIMNLRRDDFLHLITDKKS